MNSDTLSGWQPQAIKLSKKQPQKKERSPQKPNRTSLTDIINIGFICKLHKKMFSNVWKWAGKFRKSQKNTGIPYIQIEVELQTLCDDAQAWKQYNTYSPDEFAARFHHRLVLIHPFSNGNGRHARLMADLLLEKLFATKVFSWGGGSLANYNKIRKEYIKALKMADEHDYSLLLEFVRS